MKNRLSIVILFLFLPGPLATAQTTTNAIPTSAEILIFPPATVDVLTAPSASVVLQRSYAISATSPECGVPKSLVAPVQGIVNPKFWALESPFNTVNECVLPMPPNIPAAVGYPFAATFSNAATNTVSPRTAGINRFDVQNTVNPPVAPKGPVARP